MLNDPPLFCLWYEFVKWALNCTERFPKHKRFSIALKIENLGLDILQDIIQAQYKNKSKKKEHLENITTNLNVLQVLFRISMDQRYMSKQAYEFASLKIQEAGKMAYNWLKFIQHENVEPSLF